MIFIQFVFETDSEPVLLNCFVSCFKQPAESFKCCERVYRERRSLVFKFQPDSHVVIRDLIVRILEICLILSLKSDPS